MKKDPYQILGVTRGMSEEEIKKIYRSMSRKYHPDANINNPNREETEELFKEIQLAYREILDEIPNGHPVNYEEEQDRKNTVIYGAYGYTYFKQEKERQAANAPGTLPKDRDPDEEEGSMLHAAIRYYNNMCYEEAAHILHEIPDEERKADWYRYAGMTCQAVGNEEEAVCLYRKALALDPNDHECRRRLETLEQNSDWLEEMERTGGSRMGLYFVLGILLIGIIFCLVLLTI